MPDAQPTASTRLSDAALLRRFQAKQEEHAFRLLVERHGPLVLGVCRRNTFSTEDAEDAFQATFLVLAQSVGKIRRGASLSAWLYGVALRVSARVRRSRPGESLRDLEGEPVQHYDPLDELLARHDGMIADEELSALPENLQRPLVLRYLAGKSNQETASELGITVAALEGRLKRAKSRLRARLLRRGVTLATVVATLKATQVAAGGLPESLVTAATTLGCEGVAGSLTLTPTHESTITNIAVEELNVMNAFAIPKLLVPITAAGMAMLAVGVHLAYSQGPSNGEKSLTLQSAVEQVAVAATTLPAPKIASGSTGAPVPSAPTAPVLGFNTSLGFSTIPDNDSVKRIDKALNTRLTSAGMEFRDTPLEQVVDFLRTEYKIEIQIDDRALDGLGIGTDEPITCNLRNISLESALNLMLDQIELTHVISDEVLLITTQERAAEMMDAKVYPTGGPAGDADVLRTALINAVLPETWKDNGGNAVIEALPTGDLLVRQSFAGHREVATVLKQLMRSQSAGDSQPTAAQPATVKAALSSEVSELSQRVRALNDRYTDIEQRVLMRQASYNKQASESGSVRSPEHAARNEMDLQQLAQLRGELLEMRRKDATSAHGAPVGEYMEELRAEIAELTERVLARTAADFDLQLKAEEIEQLKRVAQRLRDQIEDLEVERVAAEAAQ